MDVVIIQGEISSKIVTLRGQQVIIDSPSTSSGTDYIIGFSRSRVTELSRSRVTELSRSTGTEV